jgi:hypothetical protein
MTHWWRANCQITLNVVKTVISRSSSSSYFCCVFFNWLCQRSMFKLHMLNSDYMYKCNYTVFMRGHQFCIFCTTANNHLLSYSNPRTTFYERPPILYILYNSKQPFVKLFKPTNYYMYVFLIACCPSSVCLFRATGPI